MIQILAKEFNSRSALEAQVRNAYDLTPAHKEGVEIVGKAFELALLGLSPQSIFWGISVRATDEQEVSAINEPVDRGELHDSGINGNLQKNQ